MLDLHNFRKEDAREKLILFPFGKIGLVGMDHVKLMPDSLKILKSIYDGVRYDKMMHHVAEELEKFNLLDLGNFEITPLGALFYEDRFLEPKDRWYSNSMLPYLQFFKERKNLEDYGLNLSKITDESHPFDDCVKMATFLHRLGLINTLCCRTVDRNPEYFLIDINENAEKMLFDFNSMKEIDDILKKIPNDKEQRIIIDRYRLASILSGYKYYFEAITMLGSIIEHLLFLISQEYPGYQNGDDFKDLFKFFYDNRNINQMAVNGKTLCQNGHHLKMKEDTVSLMDYRNSIHISNRLGKGELNPEAFRSYMDIFNQLCRQFKPV